MNLLSGPLFNEAFFFFISSDNKAVIKNKQCETMKEKKRWTELIMIPEREPCPNVRFYAVASLRQTYCTYLCGRFDPNMYRVVEIFLDRLMKKNP